jgi:hypothetical protein
LLILSNYKGYNVVRLFDDKMEDFKQKQLDAETYCLNKNGKLPDTWNIQKDGDRVFYLKQSTGRKRYGVIKNCEYCDRQFLAKIGPNDNNIVCSNICSVRRKINQVKINCSWCKKEVVKQASKLISKKGFHFCDRICKEEAQKISGLKDFYADAYKDGSRAYAERGFNEYGYKCADCNITTKAFLQVHHKDSNRNNGNVENLEVVCTNHHMLRHMRYRERTQEWIVDYRHLTPRDKLDELRDLLKI